MLSWIRLACGEDCRRFHRNGRRSRSIRELRIDSLESRRLMAVDVGPVRDLDGPTTLGEVVQVDGDFEGEGGSLPNFIVNGTPTSSFPSVGIVGDSSGGFCSGTLIAPQYVLTAGHCAEGVANTAGRFRLGATNYATSQVILHPQYNGDLIGEDTANDIAIFKLNQPVSGVTPSPISRSVPQVGQLLTLVGFGAGGTGNSGHDGGFGTKRVGTTPIDQVTSKLIHWRFDNNDESNTAPGDSGGPAFVQVGGVYQVAGVTSGGDLDSAGIGDHSFDTRVDAYKTWIDSIVGTTSPSTTVGVTASDAIAAETLAGQTANPGTFRVTRGGSTSAPLVVNYALTGLASNGVDYQSLSGQVTVAAGATFAEIVVRPLDDTRVEGTETVTLTLAPGGNYAVSSGQGTATISIADNEAGGSNDNFANRRLLAGNVVTTTGSNVNATREAGEPNVAGVSGGKSVWWTWTAPSSGRVVLSTAGSNFDTTLGVYTGSGLGALSRVASNDDADYFAGVYTSEVSFNATAGRAYQILVDGYYGESGNIRLSLNAAGARGGSSVPVAEPRRFAPVARRAREVAWIDAVMESECDGMIGWQ